MTEVTKWYLQWWSYPEIYLDEDYLLYVKYVQMLVLENNLDMEKILYLILHAPSIDEDYENRPTETEAMYNLFHQSLNAEVLRLSHEVRQSDL